MELMHFIAFHCISVSGWILFHRGESGKSQVCSRLQPIFSSRVLRLYISHFSVYKNGSLLAGLLPVPYISLHNGFTFWIILYSVGFFSTGFGCLPWHFPDLSPSKATCPRTVPFRSSFLFYSGPGWKERFFYHFIKTYSADFKLAGIAATDGIPLYTAAIKLCWYMLIQNLEKNNANGHSIKWKFSHTTHGNTVSIK